MQSITILLLISVITAVADLDKPQRVKYNGYYAKYTTPPYNIFNASSWLNCAVACASYEEESCRGYSFSEKLCRLYDSGLLRYPRDDQFDPEDTMIWADYGRYRGCWDDQLQRDLPSAEYNMAYALATIGHCIDHCMISGYDFAGLQYGRECRCGNSYGRYERKPDSECAKPCRGDTTTMCGDDFRNSIYSVL